MDDKDELMRLIICKNSVSLESKQEIDDDDMEELLDPDSKLFDYNDIITLGVGVGSYVGSRDDLDGKKAMLILLSAILESAKLTKKAVDNGEAKVVKDTEDKIEETFKEEDYE